MKTTLPILLLCFSLSVTFAQKDSISNIGFSFGAGSNFINMSELNERLEMYNYPLLSKKRLYLSYSIKLYGFPASEMIMEGSYYGSFQKETKNSYKLNFEHNALYFNYGYDILNKKKLNLYPVLGLGYSAVNIKITDISSTNNTFNQAISNLDNIADISTTENMFLLNIGLKLELLEYTIFGISNSTGLDIGYRIQLNKMRWKTATNQLFDSPEINLGGFYIGLEIIFE